MKITNQIQSVMAPPVSLANALKARCPDHLTLLDLSQAVPGYPPSDDIQDAAANALSDPLTHKYAPALGLAELREAHATQMNVKPEQVAITAGCNQAFAVAMQCLAQKGRKVVVPTPYYFNHQMTLQMQGFEIVPWPCRSDMSPDFDSLPSLITPDVCAVVLVSPSNPTGYTSAPDAIRSLLDQCESWGIHLILDCTYQDFVPPEQRFSPGVHHHLIQVYSFSKAYAMAGHRVGSLIGPEALIEQAEKVIDCWAICAPRLGQHMALTGIQMAQDWLTDWRVRIEQREQLLRRAFQSLSDYQIVASGAYFAWMRFDADVDSVKMATHWIEQLGIMALPAAYFGSDQPALRLAFANIDEAGIDELASRLGQGIQL